MKILLPYNTTHGKWIPDSLRITGGIEKFCHSIYDSFSEVEVLEIKNPRDFKTNTQLIQDKACEINAEIIICNWSSASFVGAKIVKSPIPILHICHANLPIGSALEAFHRLKENGHTNYLMSKYQHNYFNLFAKRMKCRKIPVEGYLNSGYVKGEKPKLVDYEWEIGTVGRCDPRDKKPFLLKDMLKESDIKNLVISTRLKKNHPNYKYYQKNKTQTDVKWNLNYDKVLEFMSKFKTHFLTHPYETWSITALESLSFGVPIIANTKRRQHKFLCWQWSTHGTHAANSVVADNSHIMNIDYNSKEQLKKAIKSFDKIDRQEIQDMTWEKHTHENWKKKLGKAIDQTIETFKKRPQ